MVRDKKYLLVCINERPPDHPKGCCSSRGSREIHARLKDMIDQRMLGDRARVLATSCLGPCENGPSVTVFPDNVWYAGVGLGDLEEIVESHIVRGEPVERLFLPEEPQGGAGLIRLT